MKKQIIYLFSAVSLALLAGCSSDSSVSTSFDDAKSKASITLAIVDGNSNEAVEGAEVKTSSSDEVSVTNERGYVIFEDKEIGQYVFEISKKDYASIRVVVDVEEKGTGDVPRVPEVFELLPLYKTGVTVKGKIYYLDESSGKLVPAKKTKVMLSYANSDVAADDDKSNGVLTKKVSVESPEPSFIIYPSEVFATTNDKGEYEFTNVAELVTFRVDVLQSKIDSKYYRSAGYVQLSGARAGSIKNMEEITMVAESETLKLVSTNLGNIEDSTKLEFDFSTGLNADSIEGFWTVKKGGSKVLTNASLSKDKKVVTIAPLSDSWSHSDSYTVEGVVYGKDGTRMTVSKSFSVGSVAIPKHVSNPKVKLDESQYDADYPAYYNYMLNGRLKLSWTPNSKDVAGYNIYYKTNVMDDFIFFAEVPDTVYSRSISTLSFLCDSSVKNVSFIILPYNGAGEPSVSKAKVVTWEIPEIKDEEEIYPEEDPVIPEDDNPEYPEEDPVIPEDDNPEYPEEDYPEEIIDDNPGVIIIE